MVLSQHRNFICKTAIIILWHSVALASGWADANEARVAPHRVIAVEHSKSPENPSAGKDAAFAVIEQVKATDIERGLEVRIVARSPLSCTPFRLTDPDRLVLDCLKAYTHVGVEPIRVAHDSVRSVRVTQFKPDVTRVVVDLDRPTAFNIRHDENSVVVTFQSTHPKRSAVEPSPITSLESQNVPVIATHARVMQDNALNTKESDKPAVSLRNDAPPAPSQSASTLPLAVPTARVSGNSTETGTDSAAPPDKLAPALPDEDYVIGTQDVLAIDVWREPEISRSVPVRPDGKISLPLVGDLTVSGLTPRELQARLEAALKEFITRPQVTVIIQEANSRKFYIMGQVEKPGTYSLAAHVAILDALAMAGGFRDFAKVGQIYLLRLQPDGSRKRVYFDYKAAVNGKSTYRDIELQPGDTLVVP